MNLDLTYRGPGARVQTDSAPGDAVTPGGPAEAAGIAAGDLIVAVDGERVSTPEDFVVQIRTRLPGDVVDAHRGQRRRTPDDLGHVGSHGRLAGPLPVLWAGVRDQRVGDDRDRGPRVAHLRSGQAAGLAQDAARLLREVRKMATGAKADLKESLGPELGDLNISDLDPRTFVSRNLFDPIEDEVTDVKRAVDGKDDESGAVNANLRVRSSTPTRPEAALS